MASPAAILRAYLVFKKVVILPNLFGELIQYDQLAGGSPGFGVKTPCYVNSMPDEMDQAVEIANTTGVLFGRDQRGGREDIHPGVKVTIRALDPEIGYDLTMAVINALNAFPPNSTVRLNKVIHYVQSIYRTTALIPLQEEVGKKRQLWVQNYRVAFQDQEPPTG